VPKRGEKKRLVEMVEKNAELVLNERLTRQQQERARRQQALAELQSVLGLSQLPQRIEAFDISNIQGTEAVGSMVVFEDGAPAPQEYRRFKIRSKSTPDDYAMMRELVYRRFARVLKEKGAGGEGGFAKMPQLVLIDGGKGQLNVASEVLKELSIDNVFLLGLAERFEEVYIEGRKDPISIPRDSHGLRILQHLRDEAHRFALTYHRQLRSRRTTHSLLDDIPGVGPKRKKQLIRHFGSVQGVREATLEELKAVPGLPASVAEKIYQGLQME
jgi:excinuclease ABC subunit C